MFPQRGVHATFAANGNVRIVPGSITVTILAVHLRQALTDTRVYLKVPGVPRLAVEDVYRQQHLVKRVGRADAGSMPPVLYRAIPGSCDKGGGITKGLSPTLVALVGKPVLRYIYVDEAMSILVVA